MKKGLYEVQKLRIQADYEEQAISKSKAQQSIKTAKTILHDILEKVATMTFTIHDLTRKEQNLIYALYDKAKEGCGR